MSVISFILNLVNLKWKIYLAHKTFNNNNNKITFYDFRTNTVYIQSIDRNFSIHIPV